MRDIFCFTDVHGMYVLYKAALNYCLEQNQENIIIYLGDAADRGPDGYKIIKELLNNPQVIYLYGNHEDLFIKAADAIIGAYSNNDERYEYLHNCNKERAKSILKEMHTRGNEDVALHIYNGGEPTLLAWLCDNANEDIIDQLRNLPRTFSYGFMDFCHAGSTYSYFKEVANAEYKGELHPWHAEYELIWNRSCIPLGWETTRTCIHGHTPTIYLPDGIYRRDKSLKNIHPCTWQDKMGSKDKRGGNKIDLDVATAFSNKIFVLNCLTMEVQGFELKDNKINLIDSYKIE